LRDRIPGQAQLACDTRIRRYQFKKVGNRLLRSDHYRRADRLQIGRFVVPMLSRRYNRYITRFQCVAMIGLAVAFTLFGAVALLSWFTARDAERRVFGSAGLHANLLIGASGLFSMAALAACATIANWHFTKRRDDTEREFASFKYPDDDRPSSSGTRT